jgi:tetratricopeptide (TPR) repeat protein
MAMWVMLMSALLPGTGLVALGRLGVGLITGATFAAALNLLLGWSLLWPDAAPRWVLWLLSLTAGAAWLASVGITGHALAGRSPAHWAATCEALFREGLTSYLRGDHEAAGKAFRAILRLRPDDVEARLRLALVAKAQGRREMAIAELRRCRYYDAGDAWRWEVERELASFQEGGG